MRWPNHLSLRSQLLWGLLLPLSLFVVVDTVSVYRQSLEAVHTAYDRTLLASAKAIGELLDIERTGTSTRIRANVPYSALEAFEADNRSRMVYRVSDAAGELIDGAPDLARWSGTLPSVGPYAALVDFYDGTFRGDPVRIAVLLQPVATGRERAMAMVQVAETLELRHTLARQILVDTLQRQAALIAVITAVVLLVVQRVTRPVRALSQLIDARTEDDLTPLPDTALPAEMQPLTQATNRVMARLQHLLDHQKRFVRDAAHQLRTPLAVLKLQVQSGRRGDLSAEAALADIEATTDRATALANQMLALAKIEQLRQQQNFDWVNWAEEVRTVALDLSPLIAQKDLEFELQAQACEVRGHEWMLRELVRNLLHNAIRHAGAGSHLTVTVGPKDGRAQMSIQDEGGGLPESVRLHLFEPFTGGGAKTGAGLGLTIAHDIATTLGGSIQLDTIHPPDRKPGLSAVVSLPLRNP